MAYVPATHEYLLNELHTQSLQCTKVPDIEAVYCGFGYRATHITCLFNSVRETLDV